MNGMSSFGNQEWLAGEFPNYINGCVFLLRGSHRNKGGNFQQAMFDDGMLTIGLLPPPS